MALAVCAFTVAGHDSLSAIAEWACDCMRCYYGRDGQRIVPVHGG